MYRDRLLKFSFLSFSLKSGIWLLGITAWIVGLLDRTLTVLSDGRTIAQEVPQLMVVMAALVCWSYLKPSSQLNDPFAVKIDGLDVSNPEK